MANVVLRIFRGDRDSGKTADYEIPLTPGHGGAGRAALRPKTPGAGSRRALELQGGQVRIVLRGSERPAAADLQDPHGFPAPRQAHHDPAHEVVSR